jgi:general secretion pathway protein G
MKNLVTKSLIMKTHKVGGFTLVELMVVLTIIALLLSVVVPDYIGRVRRAEEAVLQENLTVMRDALDKHYADAGRYPTALEELVTKRYLRAIPKDPLTQTAASWTVVRPADADKGNVYDVHSGAKGVGSNGTPYERW